jgi:hypothetical protein
VLNEIYSEFSKALSAALVERPEWSFSGYQCVLSEAGLWYSLAFFSVDVEHETLHVFWIRRVPRELLQSVDNAVVAKMADFLERWCVESPPSGGISTVVWS